ncbi:tetratricopeptide repeat protein [Phaeobacter italicus]|uniref:tetratricopeptide repeat protein n=1 Tax=Phaeobacter italicus TaxID=481446 RepID=UPI001C9600DD|nr:tetratricopeptide repeat protein [Phaeobacter italicus]MBY5976253.1 tetratricopeptide repeat protein [Phaeobacter italicus]
MRQQFFVSACLVGGLVLSACAKDDTEAVDRAFQEVNVVDESNLNDVMLTVADPNEAVTYFQRTLKSDPDRIDLNRGLALSLIRAKRDTEAVSAWQKVVSLPGATNEDRVQLADALIRTSNWDAAKSTLNAVPPTHETYQRYRLEAMVADSSKDWSRADSFYQTAVGLTTQPARVMNNWGYSKLTRGDYAEAERLFADAIRQDPNLFTAKNNMVLARSAQRNYTLPVIPLDQVERAELLHTLGLSAIKQGDIQTGESLLRQAISTHPQHFDAAARALEALENG